MTDNTNITSPVTDYQRGLKFGLLIYQIRDTTDPYYDPRYDLAVEAKTNRHGFNEFMRGLNAAFKMER